MTFEAPPEPLCKQANYKNNTKHEPLKNHCLLTKSKEVWVTAPNSPIGSSRRASGRAFDRQRGHRNCLNPVRANDCTPEIHLGNHRGFSVAFPEGFQWHFPMDCQFPLVFSKGGRRHRTNPGSLVIIITIIIIIAMTIIYIITIIMYNIVLGNKPEHKLGGPRRPVENIFRNPQTPI